MAHDRRTFLKRSGAALSAAAVSGCAPEGGRDAASARTLERSLLEAVGEVVLPGELGPEGREAAVRAFDRWAFEYEPVPELNHGYGTSQIRYGPPDPVPAWQAQLEALDLEARRRTGRGFADLDAELREAMVRRQISGAGNGLPDPLRAEHVALALLAHWFGSADARDRCYGQRIAERTCRGLADAGSEPEARA